MKFYFYRECQTVVIGGVTGQPFMFELKHFTGKGLRLIVCFNTERLINLFGFNQKVLGV